MQRGLRHALLSSLKKEKMRAHNPGMRYKFFPTDEYSTQVPRDEEDDFRPEEMTPDAEQRTFRDWYNPPGEHDNGWGGPLREAPLLGGHGRPTSQRDQPSTRQENPMPPPTQQKTCPSSRSKSRPPIRRKNSERSQSRSQQLTQMRISQMFSSSQTPGDGPSTSEAPRGRALHSSHT